MTAPRVERRSSGATVEVVVLLTAAVLVGAFMAIRYGGLTGETDTNAFAAAIRAVIAEASIVPRGAYSNGYGFPALAAILTAITGLSVAQLQLYGGALLAVWVVLPAWLAYRELTDSARAATLATVIILVQPEFLFPILRGSHEKFTRGLMFLAIYLLVRSITSRKQWRRLASFLASFYLVVYAIITFNNLFATSFITSLALSLVLSLVVRQLSGGETDGNASTRQRLLYAVLISLVLAFFFTFYAYGPARHSVLIAESIWDRLALLFLEVQEVAINPYTTVSRAWVGLPFYFLVSIANWLLLILSLGIWLYQTFTWWRGNGWPREPRPILLWSLYGAFGFIGAFSIVVDFSGALATNLQHRVFPSFAMIAAAVVADWFVRRQELRPAARRLAYGGLAIVVAFLGIVAVAKATNEPTFSNKWTYYSAAEFTALDWTRTTGPDTVTWTAFDERLRAAIGICCAWEREGVQLTNSFPSSATREYLVSDIIRARAQRLGLAPPIEGDSLRIYDNGAAELYRLRPRTPFQK